MIHHWMGLRLIDAERVLDRVRNEEWPAVRQQIDFVDATVRIAPLMGGTP